MPERIQRRRTKGWRMPENTVYVGRGSRWGNPFRAADVGSEAIAVQLFRNIMDGCWNPAALGHLSDDEYSRVYSLRGDCRHHLLLVHELRGKDLACWCPIDQPCHADVLLEIANAD